MAPLERATYFAYDEGFDPQLIRIGSLVFDYANPRTKRPYNHLGADDLFKDPASATSDQRPFCSMGHSDGRSNSFKFGLEGLLEIGHARTETKSRFVVGKNGSKVELIDPEEYFRAYILRHDLARLWLETRLSVARTMQRILKNAFTPPTIWFLTGIYQMEDAVVYHVRSKSSEMTGSGTVPVPEPTGIAQLLGINPGVTVNFGKNLEGQATAQISGKRVWAAQWVQIGSKYFDAARDKTQTDLALNQLKLLDVWSMGTERTSDSQEHMVELSPRRFESPDLEETAPGYDEHAWKVFEQVLDTLLEDLKE